MISKVIPVIILCITSCVEAREGVAQESPQNPRKRRWDILNECFKASEERVDEEISKSYSSDKCTEVLKLFDPISHDYIQDVKAIPAKEFELLRQILARTNTSIREIIYGNEAAKRLYFISPLS